MTQTTTEEAQEVTCEAAERVLRGRYWTAVRSLAADVLEAVKEGQDESDALHEIVDGSEWVIYTWRNLEVLRWTDSDGAAEDVGFDFSDVVKAKGVSGLYAILAFCALEADVRCQVEADRPEAEESA